LRHASKCYSTFFQPNIHKNFHDLQQLQNEAIRKQTAGKEVSEATLAIAEI
jgi:hypothetical protein